MDPAPGCVAPRVAVGLGNDVARDDGVGLAVARRLEILFAGHPGVDAEVEVVALPWAGLALLDVLAGRRRAAIVDALTPGLCPPGTVLRLAGDRLAVDELRGSVRLLGFHDLDFPSALALGHRLGLALPAEIAVWAISGEVVDELGEDLSPAVAAAVPAVADEVLRFLDVPQHVPEGAVS